MQDELFMRIYAFLPKKSFASANCSLPNSGLPRPVRGIESLLSPATTQRFDQANGH